MRIRGALLSIVMPGLGQLLNRQFTKAIVFLLLEHIDNRLSYINKALFLDLNGLHQKALDTVNYDYAMFYPGFYVLCVLDTVINFGETKDTKFIIWFVLAGLIGTIGIIYSRFIPIPVFGIGLFMVILMLIGTYCCSRINDYK